MVGGGGNATQGNSSKVSRLARVVLGTNRNSGDFLEHHYVKLDWTSSSRVTHISRFLWVTLYYYTTVVYLRILAPTRSLVLTVKVLPSLTNSIWRNFPSFGNFCVAFFPQLGHFRTRSVLKGSKVGIDGVVQVWKVNMGWFFALQIADGPWMRLLSKVSCLL